tara:strand:+ start:2811 stop:3113 length:303 start_codon:yes stop_codon:yes gene_type:complete
MGKLSKYILPHVPGKPGRSGRSCGYLSHTPEDVKKAAWCLDNGISIAVIPNWDTGTKWVVSITTRGVTNTDPIDYSDENALRKMYEYYEYYYVKYNVNEN